MGLVYIRNLLTGSLPKMAIAIEIMIKGSNPYKKIFFASNFLVMPLSFG